MTSRGLPISGMGVIFTVYYCVAFLLFAPESEVSRFMQFDNLAGIVAALTLSSASVGLLLHATYSAIWHAMGGYTRFGHSRKFAIVFRGEVPSQRVGAIHDREFWACATDSEVAYVRRRWAVFHQNAQLCLVSYVGIGAPAFMLGVYGGSVGVSWVKIGAFEMGLALIIAGAFINCKSAVEAIREFMAEVLDTRSHIIWHRLITLCAAR